jgi:hypothetical protein
MREAVVKVFEFKELSDEVKKRVLNKLRDVNTDCNWWEFTYEDAATIGVDIQEFDVYARHIIMVFDKLASDTAEAILRNHGEHCETYKLAQDYLAKNREITSEVVDDTEVCYLIEELDYDFREDLSKVYFDMLKKEFEFLTSDEAIIETIEQTGIEFLPDGREFME